MCGGFTLIFRNVITLTPELRLLVGSFLGGGLYTQVIRPFVELVSDKERLQASWKIWKEFKKFGEVRSLAFALPGFHKDAAYPLTIGVQEHIELKKNIS